MEKPEAILQLVNEANSLFDRGEHVAALSSIKSSPYYAELSDDSAPLLLAAMNCLLAQGDLKEAMNVVRRLDRPDLGVLTNIYRRCYLAQIQQALGEMDEALEAIEGAEMIAHQNESQIDGAVLCMISARRGYILSDLERWSDALLALNEAKQACVAGHEQDSIHLYIAYCLQAEHRYAEALQELESILPTDRITNPELVSRIHFRKGAILLQMKKYADAYRAFLEAEGGGAAELEAAIQQGKMEAATKMLVD